MNKTTRNWLITAVVLIFAASVYMYTRREVVVVRTDKAGVGPLSSVIISNGVIEPVDNFEFHASAPGTVKRVSVRQGDRVKAGELLVQLNEADARAEQARALARLRAAEANLQAIRRGGTQEEVLTNQSALAKARTERDTAARNLDSLRRLMQSGAASAGEVEAAQNRLRAAEADLRLLESKTTNRFSDPEVVRVQAEAAEARAAYDAANELVANANIRAPRAGVVYAVPVREGQYVQPGDLIVQVADYSTVNVRAFVDEPDIGRLAAQQPVTLTWDARPGRTWEGKIVRTPTTVTTRGTRSVGEVIAEVPNRDLVLLPNVNVNVQITTAKADQAVFVRREAIQQQEGKKWVYEVVGDTLEKREVKTGISNLTHIQLVDGVKPGTVVATGAVSAQPLRDGMQVRELKQ